MRPEDGWGLLAAGSVKSTSQGNKEESGRVSLHVSTRAYAMHTYVHTHNTHMQKLENEIDAVIQNVNLGLV